MNAAANIKKLFIIPLFILFMACPGHEDCNDLGSIAQVPRLITLLPAQETYNQGDQITFKLIVPAQNEYFGQDLNIFDLTNDYEASLTAGSDFIFQANTINFISGSQGEHSNWFNLPYNPNTDNYELEIEIILNKVGTYLFYVEGSILFQGSDECNRIWIDTFIDWPEYHSGRIEFTVN